MASFKHGLATRDRATRERFATLFRVQPVLRASGLLSAGPAGDALHKPLSRETADASSNPAMDFQFSPGAQKNSGDPTRDRRRIVV